MAETEYGPDADRGFGAYGVGLLTKYDGYLQRQAKASPRNRVGGRVHLVILPFFAAILLARVVFEAFSQKGPIAMSVYVVLNLVLVAALFYSGFRFIWWRQRRDREVS